MHLGLFHMKLGDMVRIGASRDGSAARMPRHGAVGLTLPEGVLPAGAYPVNYHGCNPYSLAVILNNGLRRGRTVGKFDMFAVYLSAFKYTAYQYPQELQRSGEYVGVPMAPGDPDIRVILECCCDRAGLLKQYPGKPNKSGHITNNQQLYNPGSILVQYVQLICTRSCVTAGVRPAEFITLLDRKYRRLERLASELLLDNQQSVIPRERRFKPPARIPKARPKFKGSMARSMLIHKVKQRRLKRRRLVGSRR